MTNTLPGLESIQGPNTVHRSDPIKSHDPEVNVTYREEFRGVKVWFVEDFGFHALVKLTEDREFRADAYNYTEAKMGAFRQAQEALGI